MYLCVFVCNVTALWQTETVKLRQSCARPRVCELVSNSNRNEMIKCERERKRETKSRNDETVEVAQQNTQHTHEISFERCVFGWLSLFRRSRCRCRRRCSHCQCVACFFLVLRLITCFVLLFCVVLRDTLGWDSVRAHDPTQCGFSLLCRSFFDHSFIP